MEADLHQLSKPELVRLVQALQSKVKALKANDRQTETQAPKDFEGISDIRRASPSPGSFDAKILTSAGDSVDKRKNMRYKKATAVMVNDLLRKNDTKVLDQIFNILRDG